MIREKLEEDRMIRESELNEILNEKLEKLNIVSKDVPIDERHSKKPEHHIHKPLHHEPKPKPHEKLKLDLDNNYEILLNIFDDEYTTDAVIKALKDSPVEIQIIAKITINLYKKTNKLEVNILSDKPIKVKAVGYFERRIDELG